jgi:DNA-binding NtrC family response regulator
VTVAESAATTPSAVLIVDGDIISRHALADYLRHCDYSVVEAANIGEALTALGEASLSIDVILCDVPSIGSRDSFALSSWVRANRPELKVKLAGSMETAVHTAAELCEIGPSLEKPYDQASVVDYIKRLRASRKL